MVAKMYSSGDSFSINICNYIKIVINEHSTTIFQIFDSINMNSTTTNKIRKILNIK